MERSKNPDRLFAAAIMNYVEDFALMMVLPSLKVVIWGKDDRPIYLLIYQLQLKNSYSNKHGVNCPSS